MTTKEFLKDFTPRDWKQFAMAVLLLALAVYNVSLDTLFNHGAALAAAMAAGWCLFSSIYLPVLKDYGDKFAEMQAKWDARQPDAVGKEAAQVFRQEVLDMQARGEFPGNVQIVLEADLIKRPDHNRLN